MLSEIVTKQMAPNTASNDKSVSQAYSGRDNRNIGDNRNKREDVSSCFRDRLCQTVFCLPIKNICLNTNFE